MIWANTVPWITKENAGDGQGWEPYTRERAEIAGTRSKLGLTSRLIMLSGDAHMAAIDDGTNSEYMEGTAPSTRGFVVMQAAPFSRFPRTKVARTATAARPATTSSAGRRRTPAARSRWSSRRATRPAW